MRLSVKRVALTLALLIGIAYFGSIQGSYHFDDGHSVQNNVAVRSFSNIPSFWTDSRTSSLIPENRVYRPLVYTFYTFCWAIGGGATWPFHIMKMIMHLFVALALFLIWRRLWSEPGWFPVRSLSLRVPFFSKGARVTPDWAAFLLAVAFAIHPAGTECVVYISSTTSLQTAMFYVWAFYAYLLFRDTGDKRRLGLSLLLYFLAMASKEEGITLPAMVVLSELMLNQGSLKERIKAAIPRTVPYAVMAVGLFIWWLKMNPESGLESHGSTQPFHYFITQWRAYLWYMRLWFWPFDLNADSASIVYSISLKDALVIQAAIGNALVIAFAWTQRKRFPAMLFGLVWFYVAMSPTSSVIPLAEAVNERRMYLSYIGFAGGTFAVLLWCAENFFEAATRERRLGWIYAAILIGFFIGVQERNRVWLNDENLWLDTVEKNPTSGRAMNNLALVYMGRGEHEKAIKYFEDCERHWNSYAYCSLNKGISLQALGRTTEAEAAILRAYNLNPRNVAVNYHMGQFQRDAKKDLAKAAEYFRISVDLTGGRYVDGDVALAGTLAAMGKWDEARAAIQRASDVDPGNSGILFSWAQMAFEAGNMTASVDAYRKLLEAHPNHVQAWYNLGVAQLRLSRLPEAREAFERTVAIDPQSEQGWYNLAFVAEQMRDTRKALSAVRQLAAIKPEKEEYRTRVQNLEKMVGDGK